MLRRDILKAGEKLRLKKDKRNRYSSTALRVYTNDDVWIGYVDDSHSSRIWKDMEGDESEAEFVESKFGYSEAEDEHIAFYTIPFYEEKQKENIRKRQENNAIKDLQTPEGRLEPEDIDYQSLSKEELQKKKESLASKLRSRKKKESEGEIPAEGHIKELHDIQITNLEKTLQLINDALKTKNQD